MPSIIKAKDSVNAITPIKTWPKETYFLIEQEYLFWKEHHSIRDIVWMNDVFKPMGPKCYGFIGCLIAKNRDDFDMIVTFAEDVVGLSFEVK